MQNHVSERFYDNERADTYLELIQSSLDRPQGADQAWLMDRLDLVPARPARRPVAKPRLTLKWFNLPQLPVPFLTWA